MEEEEARLKQLLDETSDYDERKKIRADLRTLRMKKLDAINDATTAESTDRATKRAERARARKQAEDTNGEVSTGRPARRAKDADEQTVEVSDQALEEMDEEGLQTLLDKLPSSQFDDRRKVRAKLREVKKRKPETEDAPVSTYTRQTKEVTTVSSEDDSGGVTMETTVQTTVETRQEVTTDYSGGDDVSFQITIGQSSEVNSEAADEGVSNEEAEEVVEDENEEVRVEIQVNGIDHRKEEEQVEESVVEDVPVQQEEAQVESDPPVEEEVNVEVEEEPQEETVVFQVDKSSAFSLDIKLDTQMNISSAEVPQDEEPQSEPEPAKETPPENNTQEEDTSEVAVQVQDDVPDGKKTTPKDTSDKKPVGKVGSRWQPGAAKEENKGGKPGDFRGGLKKSGKIGNGTVNLENKNSTNGEQVDFRDTSLKNKSSRLPTNLEKKPNTAGAQVDFRKTNLKNSGILNKATVNLEKKNSTKGAQVDFRGGLKQSNDKANDKGIVSVKMPFSVGGSNASKPADVESEEVDEAPVVPVAAPPEPEQEPVQPEVEQVKQEVEPVKPKVEPLKSKVEPPKPKIEPPKSKFPQVKQKVSPFGSKFGDKGDSKKPGTTKFGQGLSSNKFMKNKEVQPPPVQVKIAKPEHPKSSTKKAEPAPVAAEPEVNGVTVQLEKAAIAEPAAPSVQIEVSEHEEGDTTTKVTTTTTTKTDDNSVEEKKEVSSKTTGPGGKLNYQRREETATTKKKFVDPMVKQRMALRQREMVSSKKEQVSATKNKRMAFMQKLEANSPAQKGPTNIKRSGSNVDKLLAWCRFKTRDYEGLKLSNFSSSWADGMAFCALIHLYCPDKVPYEELLAGKDRKRNFEVAFSVATEAGVPELLEVEDMMMVTNPEPKSVMTYVSSIYKHFNPA